MSQLVLPYWMESSEKVQARWKLARVLGLTLGTTGIRCWMDFVWVFFLGMKCCCDPIKVKQDTMCNSLRNRVQLIDTTPMPRAPHSPTFFLMTALFSTTSAAISSTP